MELTFSFVDKIDPVALYAALLSTFIAAWEVIKWWRNGPRLEGHLSTNIILIGGMTDDNNTYIKFDVSNFGTQPTTITNVGLVGYKNHLDKIRDKPSFNAIVNHSQPAYPLPYLLNIGEKFMSMCIQEPSLEEKSRDMILYGAIFDNYSDKPYMLRVKPISEKV